MSTPSWQLSKNHQARINEQFQRMNAYQTYINDQKDYFVIIIEKIHSILEELKTKGAIAQNTKINARIKSFKSAVKNDRTKILDDVFGIEIITETENEKVIIAEKLKEYMKIVKEKDHNKENGYIAKHFLFLLKEDYLSKFDIPINKYNNVPYIECQLKTAYVKQNCHNGKTADHNKYKNLSDTEMQQIADQYRKNRFNVNEFPIMYIVDRTGVKELPVNEVCKRMYSFLPGNNQYINKDVNECEARITSSGREF